MQELSVTKRAVQEGAKARNEGVEISSNPYLKNSQSHRRWNYGHTTQHHQNILLETIIQETVSVPESEIKTKKPAKKTSALKVVSEKRTVKKTLLKKD